MSNKPFRGKQYYLGAWHYVLLDILYCIPVLGWIILLVHALRKKDSDENTSNENRMHYARSYFVRLLVVLILCLIGIAAFYFISGSESFMTKMNEILQAIRESKYPV